MCPVLFGAHRLGAPRIFPAGRSVARRGQLLEERASRRARGSRGAAAVVQVFFERIFVTRPWKALFVTTDDSIKEWWFRWKIDRYSVATGMLFGFGHYLLRQYRVLGDTHHGNLFSRGLSLSLALGALLGLGVSGVHRLLGGTPSASGWLRLCHCRLSCRQGQLLNLSLVRCFLHALALRDFVDCTNIEASGTNKSWLCQGSKLQKFQYSKKQHS